MRVIPTMPGLQLTEAMVRGGPCEPAKDFDAHARTVRQAIGELAALLRAHA